jgi:hypothetical protein
MEPGAKKTILRIELWHLILLLGLVATVGRTRFVEPTALVIGGVFMGVNFLLLSFGVALVLTPLADKGRLKAGIGLLVLKIMMFLGLLSAVFFHFELDAISFALGFTTLLIAIVIEAVRRTMTLST